MRISTDNGIGNELYGLIMARVACNIIRSNKKRILDLGG